MKKTQKELSKTRFILILCALLVLSGGCLKAKKSPFDFNSPAGFLFGFVFGNRGGATFSISGNITGFTAGTLVLQNNDKDDLIISSGTNNYIFTGISRGSEYLISVKSHPTGLACTITNGKGTLSANVTNVNIACTTSTATALYSLGNTTQSFWMDYVKSDGTSPLNATGTTCAGTETGYYNACIHAGEFKKIAIPNIISCTGITATDSLSAFNWRCVVATDGSVSVISTGLRGDKGLTDLIDFTGAGSFRDNFVTVLLNGNSFLTSTAGKWWDNPISIADSGIPAASGISKTIYIIKNGGSIVGNYNLDKTKLALLVAPNINKISTNSSGIVLLSNSFLWVEGNFEDQFGMSNNVFNNPSGNAFKFSVLRNIGINSTTSFTTGILFNQAANQSAYFHRIRIANANVSFNFNVNGLIVNGLSAYNSPSISSDGYTRNDIITLSGLFTGFAGTSLNLVNASNNLFLNGNVFNSAAGINAIRIATSNRITFMNMATANNGSAGISISSANFAQHINLCSAHNGTDYNESAPGSSDSGFKGSLKVRTTCTVVGTNPGITTVSCVKNNNGFSDTSIASVTGASVDLTNSYVGSATSDSSNTIGSAGSAGIGSITGKDWYAFQNQFRAWGKNGSFANVSSQGQCTVTCRIWDWSLKSTDTVVRNVNACPNGTTMVETHQWSAAAANQAFCDANYKGSSLSGTVCVTTFLRNAVEIFGDGVGNENGICESNEECLYTPNIGAYQGHSSDSTDPTKLIPASQASATTTACQDITTGTVSNVKLWKYEVNGY